jgi:hypothetical protein
MTSNYSLALAGRTRRGPPGRRKILDGKNPVPPFTGLVRKFQPFMGLFFFAEYVIIIESFGGNRGKK